MRWCRSFPARYSQLSSSMRKRGLGELVAESGFALGQQTDHAFQVPGTVACHLCSRVPDGGDAEFFAKANDPKAQGRGLAFTSSNFPKRIVQAREVVLPWTVVASTQGIRNDDSPG